MRRSILDLGMGTPQFAPTSGRSVPRISNGAVAAP
jgi:hypothetical protein